MEVPSRVKANRCFLEGKHAESIRFYDEALTAQPNDVVCVWYVRSLARPNLQNQRSQQSQQVSSSSYVDV